MKKSGVIAIALASIAIGYFLHGVLDFVTQSDGKVKLCALSTPIYDAEIVIYTDWFQEIGQTMYYEVHAGGQVQVPMAYFGGTEIGKLVTKDSFTVFRQRRKRLGRSCFRVGSEVDSDSPQLLDRRDLARRPAIRSTFLPPVTAARGSWTASDRKRRLRIYSWAPVAAWIPAADRSWPRYTP